MADSFTTPSRRVSSRPLQLFVEVLLLGKAAQTPMYSLTSMELILIPNCSLLCLNSYDMSSLKYVFLGGGGGSYSNEYNCCKKRK